MSLIVIRLLPETPTDAATFTEYLVGLKITLADRSFEDPSGRDPAHALGTAEYHDPPDASATIVQHVAPPLLAAPAPVATAIIHIPDVPAYPEYLGPDLAIAVTRTTGGHTQTISDNDINFNVDLTAGGMPADNDPTTYMALGPTAFYLYLPKPPITLAPGSTYLDVASDGRPPTYGAVLDAMRTVLNADPGAATDLAALTAPQCLHVATEIISNTSVSPLPAPGDQLETLYSGGNETARQQFEAALISYYAVRATKAQVLAKFVYSVSAALACSNTAHAVANVGLTLPVLPGLVLPNGRVPTTSVVVSQ